MSENPIVEIQRKVASLEAANYGLQQQVQGISQSLANIQSEDFLRPVFADIQERDTALLSILEGLRSEINTLRDRIDVLTPEGETNDAVNS